MDHGGVEVVSFSARRIAEGEERAPCGKVCTYMNDEFQVVFVERLVEEAT